MHAGLMLPSKGDLSSPIMDPNMLPNGALSEHLPMGSDEEFWNALVVKLDELFDTINTFGNEYILIFLNPKYLIFFTSIIYTNPVSPN